jgi:hypothetical protein
MRYAPSRQWPGEIRTKPSTAPAVLISLAVLGIVI